MADQNPIDYTTPVGKVRALIPDVEQLPDTVDPTFEPEFVFSDDILTVYIDLENGNIKRAAAMACEALAVSEALIAKVIKTEDLQTDGSKVAAAMLGRARQLRASANEDDIDNPTDDVFEVVPYVLYPPQQEWR